MTIHHDKMAYGKLASMQEDVSEDDLLAILGEIEGEGDESIEEQEQKADKMDK